MGGTKGNDAVINSIEEYNEFASMADVAESNLSSMRFGSHWLLRIKIKQVFDVDISDREEAIKFARKMCDEFLMSLCAE